MNTEVTKRVIPNLCGTIKVIPRTDTTLSKEGFSADAKVVGDKFAEHKLRIDNIDPHFAVNVGFDNKSSGLDATNVQAAIDEVNENIKATIHRDFNSIGLKDDDTTYTIEQVCAAVPIWSTLLLGASKGKITDLPLSYGTLEIVKGDTNYCAVRFTNSSSVSTNLYAYMGRYAPNQSNKWSGWFQINFTKVE